MDPSSINCFKNFDLFIKSPSASPKEICRFLTNKIHINSRLFYAVSMGLFGEKL